MTSLSSPMKRCAVILAGKVGVTSSEFLQEPHCRVVASQSSHMQRCHAMIPAAICTGVILDEVRVSFELIYQPSDGLVITTSCGCVNAVVPRSSTACGHSRQIWALAPFLGQKCFLAVRARWVPAQAGGPVS